MSGNMSSETLTHRHFADNADRRPMLAQAICARERRLVLQGAMQHHVIPQLLRQTPRRAAPVVRPSVAQLASLCVESDAAAVIALLTGLVDGGVSVEAIYLELLTPAARLLGDRWVDDVYSFAEVTIGSGTLNAAMRALRPTFLRQAVLQQAEPTGAARRCALLVPQAGEQHDFGVRMLSAFFRRAGWHLCAEGSTGGAAAVRAVRHEWVDLVGLSVSCDGLLDATRRSIADIRAASRNPAVAVIVGGLPFIGDPSLAAAVGADGTAADGPGAVRLAGTLRPERLAG